MNMPRFEGSAGDTILYDFQTKYLLRKGMFLAFLFQTANFRKNTF